MSLLRMLTRLAIVAAIVGAAVFAAIVFWPTGGSGRSITGLDGLNGDANRGAYLARLGGCIACHTDGAGGGAALAGGAKLQTAFGTFYSPNLTTDPKHGIGDWSLADFERALRQGISPAGQPYYPAFPYPFYRHLSNQDVADLWAAFQTVPPVALAAPAHQMRFPFGFRDGLKLWRWAYFDQAAWPEAADRSENWRRGRFLVEGPAHCGACHSPRNLFGGRIAGRALQGADGLPGDASSPAITAAALGKQGWSPAALSYGLQTGLKPDGDAFGGSMGEVVSEGLAFASEEDLRAIASYLLDLD